jgi:hypothetical protein
VSQVLYRKYSDLKKPSAKQRAEWEKDAVRWIVNQLKGFYFTTALLEQALHAFRMNCCILFEKESEERILAEASKMLRGLVDPRNKDAVVYFRIPERLEYPR